MISTVEIVRNITELSYETKLLQAALCLSICVLHQIYTGRKTYAVVYLYGLIFWGLIELALALKGIRSGTFTSPTLFGIEAGAFLSAFLRGASEGGMPTLLAIVVSDSVMGLDRARGLAAVRAIAVLLLISIFIPMAASWAPEKAVGLASSSREVFSAASVAVLGLMIGYSLLWIYLRADRFDLRRVGIMSVAMVSLSLLWNFSGYLLNVRWVEVAGARAGLATELAMLLPFQALFEVAGPYLLFYVLPRSLGQIDEAGL